MSEKIIMTKYKHITKIERYEIAILKEKWYSLRKISKQLWFSVSTISREIKRNSVKWEYKAKKPQIKSYQRRYFSKFQNMKISWNSEFRKYLEQKLKKGYNPLVIAHTRNIENSDFNISHTSIYNFLYSFMWNNLCQYLATKRYNKKKYTIKTKKEMIKFRTPIENRPENINLRHNKGHFEADLIVSKKGDNSCFLTIIDRKTRLLRAKKLTNKKPSSVLKELKIFCSELNIESINFDNGLEFGLHHKLWVKTYFCNPYSSWEKGSIENANKMLRRYFPKKSYLRDFSDKQLQKVVEKINSIPRKILDFKSPNELFYCNSN